MPPLTALSSDIKTFEEYCIGNDENEVLWVFCSFSNHSDWSWEGYFWLAWVPSTQYLVLRGWLIKLLMFLYALLNCNCVEV